MMLVNKKRLIDLVESLYDDIDGFCETSSVCIYAGEDASGEPIQLLLTMTNDDGEMVNEPNVGNICFGKYEEDIKQREEDLETSKKLATERETITTTAVNIGKSLEKVLPSMDDFRWEIPDCRFLGDPIDLVIFNGCCRNKIESISFIEVKSGKARLNRNQRRVRDAVQDKKVIYEVF